MSHSFPLHSSLYKISWTAIAIRQTTFWVWLGVQDYCFLIHFLSLVLRSAFLSTLDSVPILETLRQQTQQTKIFRLRERLNRGKENIRWLVWWIMQRIDYFDMQSEGGYSYIKCKGIFILIKFKLSKNKKLFMKLISTSKQTLFLLINLA